MRSEDTEAFSRVIDDLCLAFNRPNTDELKRVFAESLKHVHILDVRRSADEWKRNGKKFPVPRDLIPERRSTPPVVEESGPPESVYVSTANKILLRSMMRCGKAVAYIDMPKALKVKDDYVAMAESAEAEGQPMDAAEFIAMCEEGFARVIAQGGGCAKPIPGYPAWWITA